MFDIKSAILSAVFVLLSLTACGQEPKIRFGTTLPLVVQNASWDEVAATVMVKTDVENRFNMPHIIETVTVRPVCFNYGVTGQEALDKIHSFNWQPAGVAELAAFAMQVDLSDLPSGSNNLYELADVKKIRGFEQIVGLTSEHGRPMLDISVRDSEAFGACFLAIGPDQPI